MTDTEELLMRIVEHSLVYQSANRKPPLFRLTPHEHTLFREHLLKNNHFTPEYWGHLPTYMGLDFELVGKPLLFSGMHVRSDSGIEIISASMEVVK